MENVHNFMAVVRGRPRKGATAEGTTTKSLRLPDSAWVELGKRADAMGISVHELLRRLVAECLYTQTTVPPYRPELAVTRTKVTVKPPVPTRARKAPAAKKPPRSAAKRRKGA